MFAQTYECYAAFTVVVIQVIYVCGHFHRAQFLRATVICVFSSHFTLQHIDRIRFATTTKLPNVLYTYLNA